MINKDNVTHCPICKGQLYPYSIMGLGTTESCYCPDCNIVREEMMSIPFLCTECNSKSFYRQGDNKTYWLDGRETCWYCGNKEFKGYKYEDAKEKGLFDTDGYKLSSQQIEREKTECKHTNLTNKRHNEDKFKIVCSDCGRIEYLWTPKWLQEEQKIEDSIIFDKKERTSKKK